MSVPIRYSTLPSLVQVNLISRYLWGSNSNIKFGTAGLDLKIPLKFKFQHKVWYKWTWFEDTFEVHILTSSLVQLDLEISLHLDLAIQIFCLLLLLGQVFSCEFKIYFHPTDKKRVWQDAVWGFRQTTTTVRRSSRCLDKRSLGVNLQPPISERNNQTLKPKTLP